MALAFDDVDLGRDRQLVEQFQAGDPSAFEDLYRRYFARIKRYCLRRVGDVHEAEEIAQEAFTRALQRLPAFAGDRRFYPWLSVIAGRLCVDSNRRGSRSQPAAEVDTGAGEGGQEQVLAAIELSVLATAMARLAPRHREVLELRERRGWSYQRIADHHGVSLGTVEALLFRARRALRREFLAASGRESGLGNAPGNAPTTAPPRPGGRSRSLDRADSALPPRLVAGAAGALAPAGASVPALGRPPRPAPPRPAIVVDSAPPPPSRPPAPGAEPPAVSASGADWPGPGVEAAAVPEPPAVPAPAVGAPAPSRPARPAAASGSRAGPDDPSSPT